TGFYLLPFVVPTYAPRGHTPVLSETLTRDHLSVISGATPQGQLFLQSYEAALTGAQVVRFLRHLQRHLPGPLIVIWDGPPSIRTEGCKPSSGANRRVGSSWCRCRATRPS